MYREPGKQCTHGYGCCVRAPAAIHLPVARISREGWTVRPRNPGIRDRWEARRHRRGTRWRSPQVPRASEQGRSRRMDYSPSTSHLLHEPVQHPFLAGLVEIDRQLVAFDAGHIAVAEFDVEDAVADCEL